MIDYSVRFELIREAVARVAARDGGGAVCLSSIAAEMQVSPSTLRRLLRSPDALAELGVVWVARKWQRNRHQRSRPRDVPEQSLAYVKWVLCGELPIYEQEIEWASAWAALAVVGAGERIDALRHERDVWLDHLATGAVAMLAVPVERRELEAIRLRALIDGVTAAVCAGRITPDQLTACVEAHLHEISHLPALAPPDSEHR